MSEGHSDPTATTRTHRPPRREVIELPFGVHDYIRIRRIIVKDSRLHDPRIVEHSAVGYVLRIGKSRKSVAGQKYITGRVDCGRHKGGVVTAILDDAEVVATQLGLQGSVLDCE